MLLASPVGRPSRIKAHKTKAIVWDRHTIHMLGREFVTQQLPDVGRRPTAVCLCVQGWVTDVGQHGFSRLTGFINDAGLFAQASRVEVKSRVHWGWHGDLSWGRVPFLLYQSNGRGRKGRRGFPCRASFEKHRLVWLLRLQHSVGSPFSRTERVPEPASSQDNIQTNIERKWSVCIQRIKGRI